MPATRHVMLRGAVVAVAVVSLCGGAAGSVAHGPIPDALTFSAAVASVEAGALPAGRARAAATWCGSATREDLTPNVVAGHPVHWVYAFPADGFDRMTELGSVMQTDAEAIDAWWRSNDSARVPRNDLARFTCGV